jgi:hypothetical protein
MHRIIYFDTKVGYKGVYIKSVRDLINKQVEIERRGNDVICILDVDGKTVLNKFESFFDPHTSGNYLKGLRNTKSRITRSNPISPI